MVTRETNVPFTGRVEKAVETSVNITVFAGIAKTLKGSKLIIHKRCACAWGCVVRNGKRERGYACSNLENTEDIIGARIE